MNWKSLQHCYPLLLALLVFTTIVADYLSGPAIQFPILYLLPIGLASWFGMPLWGYGLAVTLPLTRICFGVIHLEAWHSPERFLNTSIRMAVFLLFVYWISRAGRQHRALQHEVQVLTGLLPICSFCKKIRNEGQTWVPLEQYISDHSEAQFSHSLCPACLKQHYPNYDISSSSANQC